MISAVRIRNKHPEWYTIIKIRSKVEMPLRIMAMVIMLAIAFFCTLGQGIGSWISFAVYMGVGVCIWLWMVLIRWKHVKVTIETPDGEKEY